jgi:hypothetical protein
LHPELNAVSCDFQNLTGQTISLLKFTFGIPGDTSTLIFTEDPDERWGGGSDRTIVENGARFTGDWGSCRARAKATSAPANSPLTSSASPRDRSLT